MSQTDRFVFLEGDIDDFTGSPIRFYEDGRLVFTMFEPKHGGRRADMHFTGFSDYTRVKFGLMPLISSANERGLQGQVRFRVVIEVIKEGEQS